MAFENKGFGWWFSITFLFFKGRELEKYFNIKELGLFIIL